MPETVHNTHIWAIPYVAYVTKEGTYLAVTQAMSNGFWFSLIPEKLEVTTDL